DRSAQLVAGTAVRGGLPVSLSAGDSAGGAASAAAVPGVRGLRAGGAGAAAEDLGVFAGGRTTVPRLAISEESGGSGGDGVRRRAGVPGLAARGVSGTARLCRKCGVGLPACPAERQLGR